MAQQTAMQTLIAWGDEMLLKHPQKILSFGEAIDKAVELLQMEKEQIMNANIEGTEHGYRERALFGLDARPYSKKRAEQYYNQTYNQNK